jgi:hypothetical protein
MKKLTILSLCLIAMVGCKYQQHREFQAAIDSGWRMDDSVNAHFGDIPLMEYYNKRLHYWLDSSIRASDNYISNHKK